MSAGALWPRRLVVAAALALLGCEAAPPLKPPATPVGAVQWRREGDARRERGDLAGALSAYEAALVREPNNVEIRYLTGVVLAALDRSADTAVVFEWVVRHGAPDSAEVALARQWLAASAPARDGADRAEARPAGAAVSPTAELHGRTEWTRLGPDRPAPRLQLLLVGDDQATRGRRFATRTTLNDSYRFSGVPPGDYRLLAQVGMTRLWSTRVSLAEGRTTVLDLTEATAVAPPDALRAPGS